MTFEMVDWYLIRDMRRKQHYSFIASVILGSAILQLCSTFRVDAFCSGFSSVALPSKTQHINKSCRRGIICMVSEGDEETPLVGGDLRVPSIPSIDVLQDQQAIADSHQTNTPTPLTSNKTLMNSVQWDVYVCESKQSKERGAGATMGAFLGLAPSQLVSVKPAIILKPKGKGPNVRCVQRKVFSVNNKLVSKSNPKSFEVNNVDSVEKVHRILTKHMNVKGVDERALKCLKYNYEGNAHLDKGEITQAIQSYERALDAGYEDQEGVLLVMRATAYLQRAFNHRKELKQALKALKEAVQWSSSKSDDKKKAESDEDLYDNFNLSLLFKIAQDNPTMAPSLFQRLQQQSDVQAQRFQQAKFRHGLYEYALLHATQDSLKSTQLLPRYAKTWLRAGDSLAELRKLKESAHYYEKALELDPALEPTLRPTIRRLLETQEALEAARSKGWPDDSLRVSLDANP